MTTGTPRAGESESAIGAVSPRGFIDARLTELRDEQFSFFSERKHFRRLSHICIVAGIVFPLLAGSAILGRQDFLKESWPVVAGLLVLAASILTSLHKGLDCEAYQARCGEAVRRLGSLAAGYERLALLSDDRLVPAIDAMEERLKEFREGPFDLPPRHWRRRSRRIS